MNTDKPMNVEAWKRVPLWLLIFLSIACNYVLFKDNQFMDMQFRMVKVGLYQDVLGFYDCELSL